MTIDVTLPPAHAPLCDQTQVINLSMPRSAPRRCLNAAFSEPHTRDILHTKLCGFRAGLLPILAIIRIVAIQTSPPETQCRALNTPARYTTVLNSSQMAGGQYNRQFFRSHASKTKTRSLERSRISRPIQEAGSVGSSFRGSAPRLSSDVV